MSDRSDRLAMARAFVVSALSVVALAFMGASAPVRAGLSTGGQTGDRIALVVGNGAYDAVSPLANPVADAMLMARTLEELGFDVTLAINAGLADMRQKIGAFGRTLRSAEPGSTALFYYAGHGVQSFGQNYLLPVDAELSDAADLDIVSIDASSVLRQMASAPHVSNIVILDACRDNPFEAIPEFNDNGLAEMKAPTGTFLSYATAPGAVAFDGRGANSPFTTALAREMAVQGAPIEQVFKQVRVAVLDETAGAQTPWDTSSLTRDFFFNPPVQMTEAESAAYNMWKQVEATADPLQIMLFLRGYPDSPWEADARALLAELMEKETNPQDRGLVRAREAGTPDPQSQVTISAVTPKSPGEQEQAMIGKAQTSGAAEDYEAYLAAFPTGIYAELARFELRVLREREQVAGIAPVTPAAPVQETVAAAPAGPVLFSTPLPDGPSEIAGRTIAEIIKGSPLFPPIDGLPPEVWKDKSCSGCHQWTAEALCTQARTYLAQDAGRSVNKMHPFGGRFKGHLRDWARGGCGT